MSYAVTAAHAARPSGDRVGEPMRLSDQRSATVSGCFFDGMMATLSSTCGKRGILRESRANGPRRCGKLCSHAALAAEKYHLWDCEKRDQRPDAQSALHAHNTASVAMSNPLE